MKTNKNKSKYKPEEIKGYMPDGTIILKEGVRKLNKYYYEDDSNPSHINKELLFRDKYYKLMTILYGEAEPESGVSE